MSELLESSHPSHPRHPEPDAQPAPPTWRIFKSQVRPRWAVPFLALDWLARWAVYGLRKLSILELLETCSSFTLLVGLIFYFAEAPERTKTRHYQAWQVINTAQGKGGSGGRIDALRELNEDRVPLVGVDVSDSFLQGVELQKADLRRSNFRAADLKGANLTGADLEQSAMISINLRNARLDNVNLTEANLSDADLANAYLIKTRLTGAIFDRADLRGVDLLGIIDWKSAVSFHLTNIHSVRNPPDGFVAWAKEKGAVDMESDAEWSTAIAHAAPHHQAVTRATSANPLPPRQSEIIQSNRDKLMKQKLERYMQHAIGGSRDAPSTPRRVTAETKEALDLSLSRRAFVSMQFGADIRPCREGNGTRPSAASDRVLRNRKCKPKGTDGGDRLRRSLQQSHAVGIGFRSHEHIPPSAWPILTRRNAVPSCVDRSPCNRSGLLTAVFL